MGEHGWYVGRRGWGGGCMGEDGGGVLSGDFLSFILQSMLFVYMTLYVRRK